MRPIHLLAPLLVAGAVMASSPQAQTLPYGGVGPGLTMVQPLPGTTDADKLADAVRRLGASPRDLAALLDAGELSFRVGDATAAAAFFKRAEAINPSEPRIKAGIARILVNGEQPGDALRYFEQATRGGLPVQAIADDRGLAYDLIGEQERAQRDYRAALRFSDSDETRRRYALSLGISGRRDEALTEIDALLRRSDRGAWRARAFILAMGGDVAGAERIATSMMPPGMASGLAPFFARLPQLGAIDRAFAVHFGEVSATPSRLADARMAPPMTALGPDPYAPVQLASATIDRGKDRKRDDRRRGRDRDRTRSTVQVAAAPREQVTGTLLPPVATASSISPPPVLAAVTLPSAPTARVVIVAPAAVPARAPILASATTPPAVRVIAATPAGVPPVPQAPLTPLAAPVPTIARAGLPAATTALATTVASTRQPAPVASVTTVTAVASAPIAAAAPASAIPVTPPPSAPIVTAAVAALPPAISAAVIAAPAGPAPASTAQPTLTVSSIVAPAAAAGAPPRLSEDTILARIIAGIAVPASELGVAPTPNASAGTVGTPTLDEAAIVAERNAAADEEKRRLAAERAEAHRLAARQAAKDAKRKQAAVAASRGTPVEAADADLPRAAGRKAPIDRKGRTIALVETDAGAPAAGKKATVDRKGRKIVLADTAPGAPAAGRKASARTGGRDTADVDEAAGGKKSAATRKGGRAADSDDAPTGKSQVWVQVAGGATEGDLAKAWSAAQAKAPVLASRKGFTTPLRATNRVVTGPFKTEEEAQALVNKLSRQGISAFTFTSARGQKVSRVGAKK